MQVGSLVECIQSPLRFLLPTPARPECDPVVGEIYTVREVRSPEPKYGFVGILLEEIVNPVNKYHKNREPSFGSGLFREVQGPKEVSIEDILS